MLLHGNAGRFPQDGASGSAACLQGGGESSPPSASGNGCNEGTCGSPTGSRNSAARRRRFVREACSSTGGVVSLVFLRRPRRSGSSAPGGGCGRGRCSEIRSTRCPSTTMRWRSSTGHPPSSSIASGRRGREGSLPVPMSGRPMLPWPGFSSRNYRSLPGRRQPPPRSAARPRGPVWWTPRVNPTA